MQKVFLVSLKFLNIVDNNNTPMVNIGILFLKDVAKRYGLNIDVIDGDFQNIVDEKIVEILLEAKPKVIGFSPFQNTMERTINIIKRLSVDLRETIIVLGGIHASLCSYEIMHDIPEVDYIIKGEAESSFTSLLLTILNKQKQDLEKIDGLVYRSNGRIIYNKSTMVQDLDSLPNIGLSQVPYTNYIMLFSSRGCVSNCSYCCAPAIMKLVKKNKYRFQSSKKVVHDIEEVLKSSNHKTITFHFYDDDFISLSENNFKRSEEIADHILSKEISAEFRFMCQAKAIVKAGTAFWKKWKKAGLTILLIGFESGSDEDLKYYNKSSNLKDAMDAYEILIECNIFFIIGFIMFNSYSDKEKILKNINFLQHINKLHEYGNISKELFPYPATNIYYRLEKESLITYKKSYLNTQIKYKDQFIENLKFEIFSHKDNQLLIDRYCFEFDYAIANNKDTINLNNLTLTLDKDLCEKYFHYKNLRAAKIYLYVNKMLNCSTNDLPNIGSEMNNLLLKIHEEFISNISLVINKMAIPKTNKIFSIISFIKKIKFN